MLSDALGISVKQQDKCTKIKMKNMPTAVKMPYKHGSDLYEHVGAL